jgi:hypothetical protein
MDVEKMNPILKYLIDHATWRDGNHHLRAKSFKTAKPVSTAWLRHSSRKPLTAALVPACIGGVRLTIAAVDWFICRSHNFAIIFARLPGGAHSAGLSPLGGRSWCSLYDPAARRLAAARRYEKVPAWAGLAGKGFTRSWLRQRSC